MSSLAKSSLFSPIDEAEYALYLKRFNQVWFERRRHVQEQRKRPQEMCPLCPNPKFETKFYCRFHAKARTANLATRTYLPWAGGWAGVCVCVFGGA